MHLLLLLVLGLALTSSRASGESAPEKVARELRIPRLEFREATVTEAVDFLRKKSQEQLGSDGTLNLNYVARGGIVPDARITCSLRDTPLLEVLQIIAQQTNLTLGATDNGIYLFPKGELPPETKGFKELGWSTHKM